MVGRHAASPGLTRHLARRRIRDMFRWIGSFLRFLRDRWQAAATMDQRLEGAKHDPSRTKDADYEKLKENGRIGPLF
jgi:hypothetical protein